MIILGIETSCDDTSVSVLKDGEVLSLAVHTQLEHEEFGGVIPEIASRAHLKMIPAVFRKALSDADITPEQIEGAGVTYGPGLVGPLLVGVNYAKGLASALEIPLVPVNHIEAHICANFIENKNIGYPFIVLVVSGGHTEIILSEVPDEYRTLSRTRDDAAGECIDKVSKMLGLGFPGGRIMDELALKGDRDFEKFPRGMKNRTDFSFSGLKTSLKYYIEKHDRAFISQNIENIAASFLDSVTDSLTEKTVREAKNNGVGTVILAGGVSANRMLRDKLGSISNTSGFTVSWPSPVYCTDNAAMVAMTAYRKILKYGGERYRFDPSLDAVPYLRL